jgi:hypothetical protein
MNGPPNEKGESIFHVFKSEPPYNMNSYSTGGNELIAPLLEKVDDRMSLLRS